MARRGNITVKIDGEYNDKDINRAIRDLNRLKTESGATAGAAGGLGRSMVALGAAFGGLLAVGSAVTFLKNYAAGAIEAARESERTNDRLDAISRSMGVLYGELGGTTKRMQDYAQSLQDATGVSDETVKSGQAVLLTFKNIASTAGEAGGMFDRATAALLDLSAAGFGDATTNAKSLGKALQDPIKGITALGRQGITFTDQEKAKIKALVESNRLLEAQGIIMASVEQQVGGTAKSMATDFDKLRASADDAQEVIGYALVRSAENVIAVFGGSQGLSGSIKGASTEIAYFIDGVGLAIVQIAKLKDSLPSGNEWFDSFTSWLGEYGPQNMIPGWYLVPEMLGKFTDEGKKASQSAEALTVAMTDGTLSQRTIAEAIKGTTGALTGQDVATQAATDAAEDAKAALEAMRDAQQQLNNSISDARALLDYRRYLQDLDVQLKGNQRSFKGHSDAVRENQDYLIEGFEKARTKVEQWARDGQISADQVESAFAGRAKKIVQAFVDDGFKLSDIRKFLKSTGLWTDELEALFSPSANQAAYDKAYAAGKRLGKNLGDGVKVGIVDPESVRGVTASAMRLIAQAEAAARAAAESHSPSLLFAEVGEDLTLGVAKGVRDKASEVAKSITAVIRDAAQAALDEARGNRDSALGAIGSVSDSIVGQVLGNVRLATADAEGNALTPQQIVQALFGGMANQQAAVDAVAKNVGATLPPELLSQMLTLPPDAAIALADYLGANPAMLAELSANYQALADSTTQQLGIPMGLAWAKVGDQSAREMLAAARELVKDRKDTFSAWVGSQLAVTIPVGFSVAGIPGRAAGGPVSGGSPYVVGERGPELFVPDQSGAIVPNHALRGGGRAPTVVNITVNAPVGADLRRAGQDIAEALAAYERGSGPIYVKAS